MQQETRNCQNCKNQFVIEPEDFDFYEKIKVPPPTWCPECRLLRRILFRNHKNLYRRPDSRTGKIVFSTYPADAPVKVWDRDDWFSDIWDALEYGKDIDWNKPFLEQLYELSKEVPCKSRSVTNLKNSDFCANANSLKDCYLVFAASYVENSYYSDQLFEVKDSFDSSYLANCEVSYQGFFNKKCFKIFFSSFCEDSQELWFCRDCVGCKNCFRSVGLRNRSYYFFNQPLTKEEYNKRIESLSLGSFSAMEGLKKKIALEWLSYPRKFMQGRHNVNVSGEYIYNSKNVKNSYRIDGGENLKYCQELYAGNPKDSYDYYRFGDNAQLIYESCICGLNISSLSFCWECWIDCSYLQYCLYCHSTKNCFGSVGLRNKQYCILNKQYAKEEYEALVPKIIKHMNDMPYVDKRGRAYRYGEFFPPEFSPFAYNETITQEYFPMTKEQAIEKGYRWKDPEARDYQIDIKTQDLPDQIKDVKDDDIVNKVIECNHKGECNEQCTAAFKIIEPELQFYKKMNLPLPRLCPNCRHAERIVQRAGFSILSRKCTCTGERSENGVYQNTTEHFHKSGHCPNEFETAYSPNRPEIVYCEQCYNSEVV